MQVFFKFSQEIFAGVINLPLFCYMNDYQQAKHLIATMELHCELFIQVTSLPNFRKYLRELVAKVNGSHQFTTRNEGKVGVKIIRIR